LRIDALLVGKALTRTVLPIHDEMKETRPTPLRSQQRGAPSICTFPIRAFAYSSLFVLAASMSITCFWDQSRNREDTSMFAKTGRFVAGVLLIVTVMFVLPAGQAQACKGGQSRQGSSQVQALLQAALQQQQASLLAALQQTNAQLTTLQQTQNPSPNQLAAMASLQQLQTALVAALQQTAALQQQTAQLTTAQLRTVGLQQMGLSTQLGTIQRRCRR
jgi:hypothetical protein